jgi:putative transcriptional regulator
MNDEMFNELLESVNEAGQILKGKKKPFRIFEFPEIEVKIIREKMGLTQFGFAMLIGVSKRTVENWEQGRRKPTGPANALLRALKADPKHVVAALHS